jgi:hypothetical protein
MSPWSAACFASRESRDRFLQAVAALRPVDVEGEPMPDQGMSALLRWRQGHFLRLNDIAYAHGGRIILAAKIRRASHRWALGSTARSGSRTPGFLRH